MDCDVCGQEFIITEDGIAHHAGDGPTGIDHDADGDHVPYSNEKIECDQCNELSAPMSRNCEFCNAYL